MEISVFTVEKKSQRKSQLQNKKNHKPVMGQKIACK